MALIRCPECGKEISDKSSECIHCGFPVADMIKNGQIIQGEMLFKENKPLPENELLTKEPLKSEEDFSVEKKEKKKGKIKPVYIFEVIVAIVAIGAGVVLFKGVRESYKELQAYNNAIQAYEDENYQDAFEYFSNSDYKDSKEYLEKTIVPYTEYLIDTNSLEEADGFLKSVSDETVRQDLETKLIYAYGIDCYNKGLFKNAWNIFTKLSDYKESEDYKTRARFMTMIQGEWILSYFENYEYHYRGAMRITCWNATAYALSGGKFEVRGSCTLELNEDNTVSFKTSDIEYNMYYAENRSYIGATLIKDSYYESLREAYYPLTPWCYGKTKNDLAFEKPDKSEIINGTAILSTPPEPQIGMTAEEVKYSTWGEPDKINEITYSWGTREQWFYSGNRNIYLDDGNVSAVSE